MGGPGFICGVMFLAIVTSLAAAQSEDSRLSHLHDKDHPVNFAPAFADRAAWEKRADFLRHQALVAQGLWPMPEKTPLNPVIHGKIDRDTYTIEKVFFASMEGHYVSGNLYRPKGKPGPFPAVLCPYGHWPDGRFIWKDDNGVQKELKSGAETDPVAARSPLQANCAMLARMGCIVFQYDMVGYCDSTKIPHRQGFLDAEAMLRCQSFMGLQTWNSVRSMDFILSLPDVDPMRVAITGSSSGGTQTMALNAVDPRAAVAVPMVMVSMNQQGGCVCEIAPLYRIGTNNVELASLFAPKPEGMAAANDWTKDFLTRGLPEMKSIWTLYGAQADVDGAHYEFGHNHNLHSREYQYNFLNEHLKLGWPSPVTEQPFEPVLPKDLSVWDAEHPMPADYLDAAGLRRVMTRESDKQIDLMSRTGELTSVLRVALSAMLVDEMPTPTEVEVASDVPALPLKSAGEWTGIIGRKRSGERVPCRARFPNDWNGNVVVWADPAGSQSIAAGSGNADSIKVLTSHGSAVIAVDVFGTGELQHRVQATTLPAATKPNPNPPYEATVNGYNRAPIAERTHDLLTAIAFARGWAGTKSVQLVGVGDAGPWALLARAAGGDSLDRAVINLNGFTFGQIKNPADPMLLPGALKYGDLPAFALLCEHGDTLISGISEVTQFEVAKGNPRLRLETAKNDPAELVEMLVR